MKPWSVPRRIRTLAALIVAIALAVAPLVVSRPAAAAKPVSSAAPRVQVLSPSFGSVRVAASKAMAATTHLRARIRLTGAITSLKVELNGHPLAVTGRGSVRSARLARASGLVVGQNLLWVSATAHGGKNPVQVADRFVVGYPVGDLLTSSGIHLGGGSAAAAALTVQAPLKNVNQTIGSLNGTSVQLPAAQRGDGGRRSLDLNLAQLGALKAGRNTFDLRIVMNDGRVQDLRHTFTLDKKRNIAVARMTGSATVGRVVTLDASRSRLVKSHALPKETHGKSHASAAVSWTLLHKPSNSKAHLGSTSGVTSSLRPDVPGTYQVALRVGSGANAGYDALDVAATPAAAMVPVETAAFENGAVGLAVGNQFYAYDKNAIQVVVMDRYTLQVTHYNSYPATTAGVNKMTSDWSKMTSDDLVAVTTQLGPYALDTNTATALNTALQQIGGNLGGNWRFENSSCWQSSGFACTEYSGKNNTWTNTGFDLSDDVSVLGVPGMPAGQAWRGRNNFVGYLTKGVTTETGLASQYVATSGQTDSYQTINTCASAGGSSCAVTVGGKTYTPPAANGFHVVVLRRDTLAAVLNTTVTTVSQLHTAINTSGSGDTYGDQPVIHYVSSGGQSDTRIVIVQSVGNGKLTGAPMSFVWQDLSQLGGTPEQLQASIDGSHRYALVGTANDLPWRGTALESSTVTDVGTAPGQATGQIEGVVHRDRTGLYLPTSGSPAGGPINDELYGAVFQDPQAWPYANDPSLPYIANGIGLAAYPDVRSAYVNLSIDFASKAVLLQNLTCSGTPSQCGNFNNVKQQLLQEFDWVQTTKGFITNLLAPYEQNGTGSVFAVDAIYDDIQNSIPPPVAKPSSFDWLGFTALVVGVAAEMTPEGAALKTALTLTGASLDFTNLLMESADGGDASATVVADSADKLSDQLALQQSATVQGLNRLETILLSDYGKVKVVGTKAGGGDADWTLSNDTTINSIDSLNVSTRVQSYSTLIPQTWVATDPEPSPKGSNESVTNDLSKYECQSVQEGHDYLPDYPFNMALPQNEFQALSRVEPDGSTMTDAWTFTQHVGSGTTVPKDSLTDKIYGPDSRTADGAFQYGPTWWRSTYNPPSGIVCYPPNGVATVWNVPPNIPLPLP